VAYAEMWAAMALCDGGATPDRLLRAACAEGRVPYYRPNFDLIDLEEGFAIYQTLSWLLGSPDGWERGRETPLEIPVRDTAGNIAADDARSLELVALVEDTRRRAAEALARK
jgi:hypothetical protein